MTIEPVYIEVAVALPVYATYTYQLQLNDSTESPIGKRVLIPFNTRRVTGYILDVVTMPEFKTSTVIDVLDEAPLFSAPMIQFFKWIADYYVHPIGEVIKNALPRGINLYDTVVITVTSKGKQALMDASASLMEKNILLQVNSGIPLNKISNYRDTSSRNLIRSILKKEWLAKKHQLTGKKKRIKTETVVALTREDIAADHFHGVKKAVIHTLIEKGSLPLNALKKLTGASKQTVSDLEKNGSILLIQKQVYRDPFGAPILPDRPPELTFEQKNVISAISNTIGKKYTAYLLAGVTGSGKTEVYMRISQTALDRGLNVIVLVPEIALITQTERRFRARFGDCVALLHSSLTDGERYDQWLRIRNQTATIAIGARSAIFAPFDSVGLIIVDEEHDDSYKQDNGLRYNARDLAVVRAKMENKTVVLGSATPSVQSSYNAYINKFKPLHLTQRVNSNPLPRITITDLRKHQTSGEPPIFTPTLHDAIQSTLDRHEQILLFLNRRGFAGFPVCRSCGKAITCKNCDVSLTLHKSLNSYKCHFCGYFQSAVAPCRNCKSQDISVVGIGTEKVEETVKNYFPQARVARLDRDTTTRKGALLKILKQLKKREIDILVGTQMIAKGHDFPYITLVGIVCADLSLNLPDFRASERTFQLLAQVAGRAGRGTAPGRVILQTYNPNHFSIASAKNQSYSDFYKTEILHRKKLDYPPFSRIAQLRISAKEKNVARMSAIAAGEICRDVLGSDQQYKNTIGLFGPIEAPLPKIAMNFRWQIMIKARHIAIMRNFLRNLMLESQLKKQPKKVRITLDVDPFFMM